MRFTHIYVEQRALEYPKTKEIMEKLTGVSDQKRVISYRTHSIHLVYMFKK